MKDFVATKRVGSVLRANETLSWLQASKVLELLEGKTGSEIDAKLHEQVQEFFGSEAELLHDNGTSSDALPSHRSRGQVYHSRRVRVSCGKFTLLVSVSFTVCVSIGLPFLGRKAQTSNSKFWCSAIITGKGRRDRLSEDRKFADVCRQVARFAPHILEVVQPLYRKAAQRVNPEINEIVRIGPGFSTLVFQVADRQFRDELKSIETGEKKLSDINSNSALGLLNQFYSGPLAMTYLHVNREQAASGDSSDVSVDAVLHTDAMRARALLIETKLRNSDCDMHWRFLGVTSASEPVKQDPARMDSEVYRLVHSPANVISAEIAAEIGERY